MGDRRLVLGPVPLSGCRAVGDEELRAEGKADQLEAGVKRAVHEVKSTVGDAVDVVKQKFGK
ncbi:CsbD family protein [Nocardia sp. NPDC055002]